MAPFFIAYIAAWTAACVIAWVIYLRDRPAFAFSHRSYWRYLGAPWKLATFAIATAGITLIAPHTGDPTWDYADALLMSVLTFVTAPWAIGVIYLALRRRAPAQQAYVAACAWMFSASWCYDIYLVWRDGIYPETWLANIGASSTLYVAAGLLWNLQWRAGRGVVFGFMLDGWPDLGSNQSGLRRIFWIALPLMLFAAIAILSFVLSNPFN
ncbi:MAG: hypothetical protein NTY05_01400 [Rhodocyclales bacterium]|nr:hypothetical protein [Rhodocyclales bacterium]